MTRRVFFLACLLSVSFIAAMVTMGDVAVAGVIFAAHFDAGPDGFVYVDNAFRGTNQPAYASGTRITSGGFRGGALRVSLGGIDNRSVSGMSGGWRTSFSLSAPSRVVLSFRAQLSQTSDYESDERSQLLVSLNGALHGVVPND
jgi:hypothetical protein